MFGLFSVEMVSISRSSSFLWEGVFFRDNSKKGELSAMESCCVMVEKNGKNNEIHGVFAECECSVAFFDSESSINEILGKRGRIELIKGLEWERGSLGIWTADDKSRRIYITM